VWIALARAADQYHGAADAMMRRALRDRLPLLTTNLILAEVHRFILFYVGIRPAAALLDHIAASPSVTVVFAGTDHHEAARRWLARFPDQRLTYTDAVSFAVMESAGCTAAMSFDHDFAVAGFALWRLA
jgi:uncharacterized protein